MLMPCLVATDTPFFCPSPLLLSHSSLLIQLVTIQDWCNLFFSRVLSYPHLWLQWSEIPFHSSEPLPAPQQMFPLASSFIFHICLSRLLCNFFSFLSSPTLLYSFFFLTSSSQSYGFSRSHVWMWELDRKEGWVPKTWCFQAGCWRRLLRVPWTTRRLSQSILREINPEEDIGQNDAEAPKLWPPDVKSWLSGKDPDNGEDWRHEEKGMAEMVGWYHWLNGHEFQQALEDSEGQRSLTCCSSWGRKKLDTTEWLNKIHTTWWDKLVWLKKQRLQRDRLWFICHLCYFPTGSNYSIMPLLLLLLLQSHFSHVRLCATP